jgi:hypothetical protein
MSVEQPGQLEQLFAPRWAGGWTVARVLFALAILESHLLRIPSVLNALAAPTLNLSSGPAAQFDHVVLGSVGAWAVWGAGLLGGIGLLYGGRFAKPGLLLWAVAYAALLVCLGLNVRAPERLLVWITMVMLASPMGERGLVEKARSPAARWMVMIVLCSLYGSTGWMKLLEEPGWWTGEALAYDLVDRHHAGGIIAAWLSGQALLCRLMSWFTMLFETSFPFLVGFSALTPWLLAAGIGMHLGIGLLMDVGPLGLVCMAMYPVVLAPEVGHTLWLRLRARFPALVAAERW